MNVIDSGKFRFPFNKPYLSPGFDQRIKEVLAHGDLSGDGHYTRMSQDIISSVTATRYSFLCSSCTDALEMTSHLLGIRAGDEVIMPSFNFTSGALAVANLGATPVFVDIDPLSLNIDANLIEREITSKTKAISFINYGGVGANFQLLRELAQSYSLKLIEDNAHGFGNSFGGQPLGSYGDISVHSFHSTKNIQCGEGGSISFSNPELYETAAAIWQKGTNRLSMKRGLIKKYEWVSLGSSYLPSELTAALLFTQLSNLHLINGWRSNIIVRYQENLAGFFRDRGVRHLTSSDPNSSPNHLFYFIPLSTRDRDRIETKMHSQGVQVVTHYQALHRSVAGQRFGRFSNNLSHTDEVSRNLLRLPVHHNLTLDDVDSICAYVIEAFK
jgi:dTDP-4-amino-4,6-dideoxygalactose transaminase